MILKKLSQIMKLRKKTNLIDRKNVINNTSKLYDKLLNKYGTQYNKLSEDQKKMINVVDKPGMLSLDFTEDDLVPMFSLEGDEEPEETIAERLKLNPRERKNERTGLKILTPNKLLTRLPTLLTQIKAESNS